MDIFAIVAYSLIVLLGVTGNGLVIFITGFRMKRTVNTVWFLNLAIADFTFTFSLLLIITDLVLERWPFGNVMCKIGSTLSYLNLYGSIYLLMVISLDRCISTLWPVWAHNHRTPQRASIVAFGVWILALVLCSPHIYFSGEVLYPNGKEGCVPDYGNTQEQNKFTHKAMTISRFTFAFVIPFSVIVVCYGAVVLKLRRNQLSQSNKPIKVITAVTVAFFVCWLPSHILSFYKKEPENQESQSELFIICERLAYCLAFINSCLNPILYAFMGYDFRQKLRHSLLSAFENAFAEDSAQNTGSSNIKSSAALELQ
ncbi:2-like receptor 1 [Podarcis lilfordi]|uniref:2-like receptor 1 n=1 Tax=Podarcis lilfordi TaxID=74358 RepID=A0AA35KPD0_9SAUR|nr:2-like receptor 1 [Podarcis lilfordi]